MKSLAPVLIPTLNRYNHFKRCVESLAKCTHADKTDLFIALDYPAKPEHEEGHKKIKEYLNHIKGFKSVNVIHRERNFGVPNNMNNAREVHIFSKYDRIINSEDDNEFAPNFLDYINKALDHFEDNNNVFMVCGYNSPIKMPEKYSNTYYFSQRFNAWGTGMWKMKYPPSLVWDHKKLKELFANRDLRKKLKYQNEKLYYTIKKRIAENKNLLGDGVITLLNIKNSTYCVFPKISLVRNHGFDGSGKHNKLIFNNPFQEQDISSEKYFLFTGKIQLSEDKMISKLFHKYYSYSWYKRIKIEIKHCYLGILRTLENLLK